DLYVRLMLGNGPGYPMWQPGPNLDGRLHRKYRQRGISIGDVGCINSRGTFDFFFNILLAGNDPINGGGSYTPQKFLPLPSSWSEEAGTEGFGTGTTVYSLQSCICFTNKGDREGSASAFHFRIADTPGAICVLPTGAQTHTFGNLSNIQDYISAHAVEWYRHINGPRGRLVENGSLYLITGTTKTDSWGFYAVDNIPRADGQVLTFGHLRNEPSKYYWSGDRISGNIKHRDFDDEFFDCPNQAVFISAFKISLGRRYLDLWGEPKGVKVAHLDRSNNSTQWVPFRSQITVVPEEQCRIRTPRRHHSLRGR
ncbi:hypothetical protein C8R43DRAFT_870053, partial [Mycena crocata]